MIKLFRWLIFFCIVCSCSSEVKKQIDLAEALAYDHPDSALAVLDRIERGSINTAKDKAHYALVKSMVLDLNFIDVQSDSLVSVAVNYYQGHGDQRYLMLALFYKAIILKNQQQYTNAIVFYDKAEEIASEIKNYRYVGLCNRYKADLFTKTHNLEESKRCVARAINAFKLAGMNSHREYAEYSMAVTLVNTKEYEKARVMIDSILSTNLNDAYLIAHYNKLLGNIYIIKKEEEADKAIEYFRKVPEKYYSLLDYSRLALAYAEDGQRDSADKWIEIAYSKARSHADSAAVSYDLSRIKAKDGDYKDAYNLVRDALLAQDAQTRDLLQQSLTAAQRDNYKYEMQLEKAQSDIQRQRSVFLIILIILLLGGCIGFLISRNVRKNRELKEKVLSLNESIRTTMDLKGAIFRDKFAILEQLSFDYSDADSRKQKEIVFNKFKKVLSELRNKESLFMSLEEDLNRYCDNIMNKFTRQVPSIKGENLKMIQLFFAGIRDEEVMLIMKRPSLGSIKTLKSRLRIMIKEAGAEDEQLFLELLETKKRPPRNKKTKDFE
ncbi:MAG: hypothetical protein J6W74_02815 [Bacteroidales bacterium]|nr:hypothetical protein [Bacteroidales bacterium]